MATLNPYVHHAATITTISLGLLGAGGGLFGLLRPAQCSTSFLGLPLRPASSPSKSTSSAAAPADLAPTATTKDLFFISFIAARNLSSGLGLLTLLYLGQRKAIGYLLLTGSVTAAVDAWACAAYPVVEEGKALGHAITSVVIAGLGAVITLGY